jgi:YVTN family beta-propeller protein
MKYLIKLKPWIELRLQKVAVRRLRAALAAVAIVIAGQPLPSLAQAVSGLINPQAVAFNPANGKVYTVDTDGGSVYISDDSVNSTIRIKVGAGPVSIAVDASNGRAYVANAGDGTMSVIDGKTDAVVAIVPIGNHPYSIAADSVTGRIYVSRTYSDQLMIIDAATNKVSGIKTGSSDLIAVDSKRGTVFLLGYEGGNLAVLDEASDTFSERSAGMHAWGIALNEVTGNLYVAKPGDVGVAEFEAGSISPRMIPAGQIPCSVAVNSRTNTVYVANYGDSSVTVIDGAKGRTIATLSTGNRPEAVTVDVVDNLVFVANTLGNSITVIDGGVNRVLDTLDAGKAPYALIVNPLSGKLHVANVDKTSFTIIDVSRFRKPRL